MRKTGIDRQGVRHVGTLRVQQRLHARQPGDDGRMHQERVKDDNRTQTCMLDSDWIDCSS